MFWPCMAQPAMSGDLLPEGSEAGFDLFYPPSFIVLTAQ